MSQTTMTFDTRLKRLLRRHSKMRDNGIVHKLGRDGLISAYPRRRLPTFPLHGILVLFCAALLYKAFLLAYLGSATYQSRVEQLSGGTVVEQGGAWILQADPATVAVANLIKPLIPSP